MKKTAAKITMPSSKFSMALAAGSVEPAMKSAEAKSTKLFRVPVAKIEQMPGFNVRVQSADYLAHRDSIAESIRENGYDMTKPISGYVHKAEGGANIIYVTDGHTRLDAVNKLNAEDGATQIETLPVLVHPGDKTLTDLTVALHTSNTGRPLTPFELGVVVKRLLKEDGAEKGAIAKRLAVTPRYLDDVLLLVNGPKAVRDAVLDGSVSSTLAIQELRKSPEKAAEKIADAVAKSEPGKKVTKKALGPKMKKVRATVSVAAGTDMKEIVKAVAMQVRAAIAHIPHATDPEAKVADVDGTISIVVEVPDDTPTAEPKAEKTVKKASATKPAKDKDGGDKVKAEAKPVTAPAAKVKKAKPAPAPVEEAPAADDDNLSADTDDAENEIGIEGAEEVTSDGIDDEPAITPIAVKNGEGVNDDVDI
jgi:ParB family chromosome partitioning protein